MSDYADLLGRAPLNPDPLMATELIKGATVLVTGAGGSIGSELCRQIDRLNPKALVLLDRAEDNLFRIHRQVPSAIPCIGDVCDRQRVEDIFSMHRPNLVLHAAAYKHVPMMEVNAAEAVRNNVIGTRTVADAAAVFNVDRFVLVSTDKAVAPTSVMGATKRIAELYVKALHGRTDIFTIVRFGNVLGSTGSVVPIFEEQIERGGPVTVTHPDMLRYFMTIPEACQLVLQAAAMGNGGEIFVLDMGAPMRVLDIAKEMIRRSGKDVEIVFTGIRPGEKLVEELSRDCLGRTEHPGILVSMPKSYLLEDVVSVISEIRGAADVRARLMEIACAF